ncbi:hypothetical protein KOW79_013570 [Hemibagrus wyckioides]|uniref:Uncharacterized protein n=1 Tax=Hemibagrus wyckioides TaxID=337641 RepID=A0A9D3SLI3_9TELE|nr:hypothetical protein KOW79_013570 [Hemibagrus wyckioides]
MRLRAHTASLREPQCAWCMPAEACGRAQGEPMQLCEAWCASLREHCACLRNICVSPGELQCSVRACVPVRVQPQVSLRSFVICVLLRAFARCPVSLVRACVNAPVPMRIAVSS